MRDLLAVTKALADANRVRILCALEGRELCVCQITALLGLAPSTVSKHMSVLHQARLVEAHKQGRWMFYRLADQDAPPAARDALAWTLDHARTTAAVHEDFRKLKRILKIDPEELCRTLSAG